MCEAALLCRLMCCRFVASSASQLVADGGRGVSLHFKFDKGATTLTTTVAPNTGRSPTVRRKTIKNDKLLSNVMPRGPDGGLIFTAALARWANNETSFARIQRETEPGVSPSLPRSTNAHELAAGAAAFCGLRLHSFSLQMRMALMAQCVSITFRDQHAVISTGCSHRRVTLPHGAKYTVSAQSIYIDSTDAPRFNADIALANICHTLSGMVST